MTTKTTNPHRERILTADVICAWVIAALMMGALALLGYGNGSLPFPS